jgi:hypothetical protein
MQHKMLTTKFGDQRAIPNENYYKEDELAYSEDKIQPLSDNNRTTPTSGGSKLVTIPKDGNFAGSEIVQIMKVHLRSKY